jgi:hypothetical protein
MSASVPKRTCSDCGLESAFRGKAVAERLALAKNSAIVIVSFLQSRECPCKGHKDARGYDAAIRVPIRFALAAP